MSRWKKNDPEPNPEPAELYVEPGAVPPDPSALPDDLAAENARLKARIAELEAAPAAAPAASGTQWRVHLRHSPVGAAARLNRTVEAATREEAWKVFIKACHEHLKKNTTKSGQKLVQQFETWKGGENAIPAVPDGCEIVPESQAEATLAKSRITAPTVG